MKIIVDTHTHSISSGHAYSTIQEMAAAAAANGIKMFAITDHGPAMKGAPYLYHFGNLRAVPSTINGVRILKGVEANIINFDGETDMPDDYLERLDFAIASFHDICIAPSTVEEHTNAVIGVLKNPYIDAVAHPGNPQFQIDIDKVVKAAKEYNKFLEINNQSFVVRKGSEGNCYHLARKCKVLSVGMVCDSDTHISFDVGRFDRVNKIFETEQIGEELILNTSLEKFEDYLITRRKRFAKEKSKT